MRSGLLRELTAVFDQAAGTERHSAVSSLLDSCKSEKDLQILREVAGTGYGGVFRIPGKMTFTNIYLRLKKLE